MDQKKDLGGLRKSYDKGDLSDDMRFLSPIELFSRWFEEASDHAQIEEANAMSLSTLGKDGFPVARVVLLKAYSEAGFTFYTNYRSNKGVAIKTHNQVGLSFFWPALERQVIIRGRAEKLDASTSDAYFLSRPLGSQLGAIASAQSSEIANREQLDNRLKELSKHFENEIPQRPGHWGGYLVTPEQIEFWQGRPNRMHDRLEFSLNDDQQWTSKRLAP